MPRWPPGPDGWQQAAVVIWESPGADTKMRFTAPFSAGLLYSHQDSEERMRADHRLRAIRI